MQDRLKVRLMFEAVSKAPMSARTRSTLQAFVTAGDCRGLLRYLEHCLVAQGEVGRSVDAAGLVSFESQMPTVRRIYASGSTAANELAPEDASLLAFVDTACAKGETETLLTLLNVRRVDEYEEDFLSEFIDIEEDDRHEEEHYEAFPYYNDDRDEWIDADGGVHDVQEEVQLYDPDPDPPNQTQTIEMTGRSCTSLRPDKQGTRYPCGGRTG